MKMDYACVSQGSDDVDHDDAERYGGRVDGRRGGRVDGRRGGRDD